MRNKRRNADGKTNEEEKQIQNTKTIYGYLLPAIAELYLEVTGSNPAGVLCYFLFCFVFFPGFLRKCKNCFHNCEDHSSFDFISAVLI